MAKAPPKPLPKPPPDTPKQSLSQIIMWNADDRAKFNSLENRAWYISNIEGP